jgi:hypothetical protein
MLPRFSGGNWTAIRRAVSFEIGGAGHGLALATQVR